MQLAGLAGRWSFGAGLKGAALRGSAVSSAIGPCLSHHQRCRGRTGSCPCRSRGATCLRGWHAGLWSKPHPSVEVVAPTPDRGAGGGGRMGLRGLDFGGEAAVTVRCRALVVGSVRPDALLGFASCACGLGEMVGRRLVFWS